MNGACQRHPVSSISENSAVKLESSGLQAYNPKRTSVPDAIGG
jgi:hypothetical protein